MIAITGAAGFIGSCVWAYLLEQGITDIIAIDNFSPRSKQPNWENKTCVQRIDRGAFLSELQRKENKYNIDFVLHLGARTDTTEKDRAVFDALNLHYSCQLFDWCAQLKIPIVYASSAATYGLGEHGYHDNTLPQQLRPLNPYGHSKNDFDAWALAQLKTPPFWAGLKFFNVYGANEYHKGRMASVVWHTYQQIQKTGGMQLFRSHKEGIGDGQQQRDFIYVKDIVNIIWFMYQQRPPSGIYNAGTGNARSFWDLAAATFKALGKEPNISFIDTPPDIRDTYQYFTQADMRKLRLMGYRQPFYSLEDGVTEYVQQYLQPMKIW